MSRTEPPVPGRLHSCYSCGPTERELRPYGPGGAPICHPCMKADPEREKAASQVYIGKLIEAAGQSNNGTVVIGAEDGPQPGNTTRRTT